VYSSEVQRHFSHVRHCNRYAIWKEHHGIWEFGKLVSSIPVENIFPADFSRSPDYRTRKEEFPRLAYLVREAGFVSRMTAKSLRNDEQK